MMTFGSLFSGIGGLDLGLERAGMRCAWQVELDPFCQKILSKRWPSTPRFEDVTKVSGGVLASVELVAGGFPCQPISHAGRRRGVEDEKWLWPEFERIVHELKPRFVLIENVPSLRQRGLSEVIEGLNSCGYDAEWDCIPAAFVNAPHIRDRIWILAYARGERHRASQDTVFAGRPRFEFCARWADEPSVGRVAYGVPGRVDRMRAIGNAVVPQVAEYIGRCLLNEATS